jgi:opacity protein-like surface antigen
MKKLRYISLIIFILSTAITYATEISISTRLGYSPKVGGSMSSTGQTDSANNLRVADGINDINRSGGGFAVSTVEDPLGVIAGADIRIIANSVYYRAGIEYVYVLAGGTGKTLDYSGSEVVDVTYSQWSFDVPLTIGISMVFWGESRIYVGGGVAYAYGTYSNSFKSATLVDFNASFTGYAIPLVAEIGCEYLLNDKFSIGCDVKYFYGKSIVVEDGTDSARVDFSGFHITASAVLSFNF